MYIMCVFGCSRQSDDYPNQENFFVGDSKLILKRYIIIHSGYHNVRGPRPAENCNIRYILCLGYYNRNIRVGLGNTDFLVRRYLHQPRVVYVQI